MCIPFYIFYTLLFHNCFAKKSSFLFFYKKNHGSRLRLPVQVRGKVTVTAPRSCNCGRRPRLGPITPGRSLPALLLASAVGSSLKFSPHKISKLLLFNFHFNFYFKLYLLFLKIKISLLHENWSIKILFHSAIYLYG